MLKKPSCILFDLDGTLIDSAPDLVGAINLVRTERGLPEMPYEDLRGSASAGAPGLIGTAFHLTPQSVPYYAPLRERFLANYAANIAVYTKPFEGIRNILDTLDAKGVARGVVTNKYARLTVPLLEKIGLSGFHCVICGDTAPRAKPFPDPLFEAAKQTGISPSDTWFIGDDPRDIMAGKAAGCATLAAGWGYGSAIESWGADVIAKDPAHLMELVLSALA